jgi:hypothetical protein
MVKPELERSEESATSWVEVVDEALDTTDAFWAVLSIESSRVRRFTYPRLIIVSVKAKIAAGTYHCLLFLFELHVQLRCRQRTRVSQRPWA